MRPVLIAAAALAFATSCAYAGEKATNPCSLLDMDDFSSLGAKKDTAMAEAGWHKETTPQQLPGSELYTNLCAVTLLSEQGRTSITLSFDSFLGSINEGQVKIWLQSAGESEPDTKVAKLGDTTCESGQYDLPTSQEDGSLSDVEEHYIACDQQVGVQHVSLNIHVPGKKIVDLPTAEKTKALLDKAVVRMKETSFGPLPEKSN